MTTDKEIHFSVGVVVNKRNARSVVASLFIKVREVHHVCRLFRKRNAHTIHAHDD